MDSNHHKTDLQSGTLPFMQLNLTSRIGLEPI